MTETKPKIDWLNHGLEFIVVIIGILIAFQLNQCSSDRQQLQTVQNHVDEIIKETKFNKVAFERAINAGESHLGMLDSIVTLVSQKGNPRTINFLAMSLLDLNAVYYRKNAYATLVETGDMKFIKDFEQKQEIVNLYEYYKWVEVFNDISESLYLQDFYPYLKENFDLVSMTVQEDEIYHTKLFKNILGAYNRTSQNRVNKYKDCLKEIEKFLENKSG